MSNGQKKKILWLTNIILPEIANAIGVKHGYGGGWIIGMIDSIKNNEDFELIYCFCLPKHNEVVSGQIDGIKYYGVPKRIDDPTKFDDKLELYFKDIIKKEKPDIVHIFGTEFPHTLSMVKAVNNKNKTVISIQGLVSIYSQHYYATLPNEIVKRLTFKDLIRKNNIIDQKKKFELRGKYEIKAIQNAGHIIGRTDWDKACTSQINPNAQYHFCNETLRKEFYKHKWTLEECEKHSIFISQASYPIKGLHFMLEAMPLILKRFPDSKLYIAGGDFTKGDTLIEKLKRGSYTKYIIELIKKYDLKNNVCFLGDLTEERMCEQYLKSNVFVCPSSIENSPNSLGEAMILGVPCVASDVGGVTTMMEHNEEGFVYQSDAPYMLAYYVCELFGDYNLAKEISLNTRNKAFNIYDKDHNYNQLIMIYKKIAESEK